MRKTVVLISVITLVVLSCSWPASARPTVQEERSSLSRPKRQSDQRLAELETLLALQKYGRHRFRMDRKKGVDGEHQPGYGIIDFRMLGRKKKSLRFSPGELEITGKQDEHKESPLSLILWERALKAEEDGESVFPKETRHQQILGEETMTQRDDEREQDRAPLFLESDSKK